MDEDMDEDEEVCLTKDSPVGTVQDLDENSDVVKLPKVLLLGLGLEMVECILSI